MWELPRKLDNNKTYSKADDRQRGENFSFYEKFKMNISVEVLRPALSFIKIITAISWKFLTCGLSQNFSITVNSPKKGENLILSLKTFQVFCFSEEGHTENHRIVPS
ncbi:hypothetical protein C4Q31_11730 [Leptospira borgpetersenii serovar Ceylonica]|nr:hypothetical protein C4Q31_11730 [Leptospira borgpetersenii serovar Ceylonica]KGE23845.1 hypothetical protein IQ66_10675 [Leptospira borgpetersenii serovar Ballum]QHH49913.1 hypothetical protein GS516_07155 [Leptospira borgpetersenii]MBE8225409.1 hypothetical protein [Leptospira borgpetersenii serovar Ballum]MBE8246418.1 hypothetical protein [Leptospira borgpetersenii serovar Ballum]